MLHFDQIQAAALAQADQLLIEWFPNGRQVGREFKVGNLAGEPGQSLSINLDTGLWSDFAVGVGGRDLIDLYAKLRHGGDRVPAARALTDMLGIRDDAELRADDIRHNGNESFSNEWLPMAPPPGTLRPDDALAEFDVVYEYTDAADRVTHYVGRIEARNGRRKQFVPITFGTFGGATGWHKKAPAIPRPLYGLNRLATKPEAAVILCEGEKAADAAQAMFLDHACVAWFGGTGSVDHADLTPLEDRDVVIWPDNDKPGHEAAGKLAKHLPPARVLRVDDLPDGADAADVAPDDPDAWLAERLPPDPAADLRDRLPVHTFGALLDDDSPMPDDILAPRVLTPGGILVIGGAPKVGKSDLLINLLVHAAAGAPFLCFTPPRPLRIIYLQAEIQYHYLRERLQGLKLDPQLIASARDNLAVTPKLRMLLNDDGLALTIAAIRRQFPDAPPDIICLDPIRNLFDGGPDGLGENDNNAMMFFLQNRVEALREEVAPDAGLILCHHTKKLGKNQLQEDPFMALSGASALRSFYSSGMIMFRSDEKLSERRLVIELRNGPAMDELRIDKVGGRWVMLGPSGERLVRKDIGERLDAERVRKHDVILGLLLDEAVAGHLYTINQFVERFENQAGLGGKETIRDRLNVLATKSYIKFLRDYPQYGLPGARSRFGYMCVETMRLGPTETVVDPETGEVEDVLKQLLPTHYKCPMSGAVLPVEDPETWIYHDGDGT